MKWPKCCTGKLSYLKKYISFRRRWSSSGRLLNMERLEPRELLSVTQLATFEGAILTSGEETQVSLMLSGTEQPVVVSVHVEAADGSSLNPAAPWLKDLSGAPIEAMVKRSDGGVAVALPAGEYHLFVAGEEDTTGPFVSFVTLAGDMDGNGQVSEQEYQNATAAVVQAQFGLNHVSSQIFANLGIDVSNDLYHPGLDPNGNGVVDHFDRDLITANLGVLPLQVEFATDASAPEIVAALSGDTGWSGSDGITNDPAMSINGNVSDQSPITLFTASVDGSVPVELGELLGQDFSSGGSFSLDLSQLQSIGGTDVGSLTNDGPHVLSLIAEDEEGHVSPQSFDFTFELDDIPPAAPTALDLDSAADTGDSSVDNVTNENALTIHADAEDGALIELFSSLVSDPIGAENASTSVTIHTLPLPSGSQEITATATDIAGNTSSFSDPLSITIDNAAPAAPTFDLKFTSDTGAVGDHLTTETLVTLVGTAEANASVQLQRAESTLADVAVDSVGLFVFDDVALPFGANEFVAVVSDAAGNSTSAAATFTRNNPPVVDDQAFTVNEQSPYGTLVGTVVASDMDLTEGDSLQFTITDGNDDGAFNIDGATGEMTVTDSSLLDFNTSPTFSVTVRVTDVGGAGTSTAETGLTDTAVITINLSNVNDPPVVSDATFVVPENSAVDTAVGTVAVSDPDVGSTHSFVISSGNPNGAFAINANTGEIIVSNSAVLDFETQQLFSMTVTATDGGGMDDSATIGIELTDVNESPVLADQAFSVSSSIPDGFVIGTVSVADPDVDDTFVFEMIGSSPSTTLFSIDSNTGAISVPDADDLTPGTDFVLSVRVMDMGGTGLSDDANITASVIPNVLPIAVDDLVVTGEDSSLVIDVLADNGNGEDSDPDGDDGDLSVTAFDAVSSLGASVTDQGDGTFIYDSSSAAGLQSLAVDETVTDTFTYEISDLDDGKDSATVFITVSGFNDLPAAVNDELTVDEDSMTSFNPLADNGNGPDNDPDVGDTLTVTSVDITSSLGADVTLGGDGMVSYDPRTSATLQALSATGSPMVDTFTYHVSDSHAGTDTATVFMTVLGVDEAVVAVGEVFQVDQDSTNDFSVLSNDSTTSGFPGTLSVTSASVLIPGANATPSSDGQGIVYVPASGYLGRDIVSYTVSDSGGGSDTVQATVEVTMGPADLQKHIHADLSVFVNGLRQSDPPNEIGVESTDASGTVFTSPVHTHGADGRIHVHPVNGAAATEFTTVGDFFETWRTNAGLAGNNPDAIFNANQIYENVADQNYDIQMFVNGLPNFDYENYVIEDEDEIVIVYEAAVNAETPNVLPIGDVELLSGSPLHISLDGFDLQHDALTFTASSSDPSLVEPTVLEANRNMVVTVEDVGVMNFQLFDNRVPRVTGQISALAADYSDVPFHRVIDEFVIQGGDITNNDGTGGSSLGDFDDQFHVDLQHNRTGLLSMAKSGDDTNDSQFFVTEGPTRFLDFNHAVFGVLVEGERVRELISNVETDGSDTPLDPVLMDHVEIVTDTENGVLMIEAPEGASGEADVTVTVEDGPGNVASRTFHVTVVPDTLDGAPFLGELPATVAATTGQSATISVDGGSGDLVLDAEDGPFFLDVLERGSRLAFDYTGDDATVTADGVTDFSFNGSNWTGGQAVSAGGGFNGLFASRPGGYLIDEGGGQVTFDSPVNSVSFYFTHGQGGVLEGTASAFDAADVLVSISSSRDTSTGGTDGDPDNFVAFSSNTLISRVEFSGGFVDDFNFRRFVFSLDDAIQQVTVTPQPGVTGTLPVEFRLRPAERSDTGAGFDFDTQDVDIIFGDAATLTTGLSVYNADANVSSEGGVLTGQLETIDELMQSSLAEHMVVDSIYQELGAA